MAQRLDLKPSKQGKRSDAAAETGTLHPAVPRRSSQACSGVACLSLLWLWRELLWLGPMTESTRTAVASRRRHGKSEERLGNDLHRRHMENDPQDRRSYAVSFEKIQSFPGFLAATLIEPGLEEMALAFQNGRYGHYRDQVYNNVAMRANALSLSQNPAELSRPYAPLKVR